MMNNITNLDGIYQFDCDDCEQIYIGQTSTKEQITYQHGNLKYSKPER